MRRSQVLVIGAGPTGLVLALWLTRLGVSVRVIDRAASAGTASRALAVQARTLELYRQLGLAGELVGHGQELVAANVWAHGRHAGRAAFGALGQGLSPFPYLLIYPQDEHEQMLIARLAAEGVRIERRTELTNLEWSEAGVRVRLRRPDGTEEVAAADYVAGCDGSSSTVREQLGVSFPGGTYAQRFYVADVRARGPVMDGELHVALDDADFLGVFPLGPDGHARLIGTALGDAHAWEDVSRSILARMRIEVDQVAWFSTYHVHHRVAGRFRVGRTFLLGDAAHIHSPVGGQGMNTGIGDAVNLAWKLAAVLNGDAPPELLDSYEPERIAFARRLEHTTDQAFKLVTRRGRLADRLRVDVVPRLLAALFHLRVFRRLMFRTVSQTMIRYRSSALSEGSAGAVHGGDRLPWVAPEPGERDDNFTPLESLSWQVHVYGRASAAIRRTCETRGLALVERRWRAAARRAGLRRNAVYLVRPDGHVALADARADAHVLEHYLDRQGITLLRRGRSHAGSAPVLIAGR